MNCNICSIDIIISNTNKCPSCNALYCHTCLSKIFNTCSFCKNITSDSIRKSNPNWIKKAKPVNPLTKYTTNNPRNIPYVDSINSEFNRIESLVKQEDEVSKIIYAYNLLKKKMKRQHDEYIQETKIPKINKPLTDDMKKALKTFKI